MASIKQIEANRLNAKKSTGPRTSEGKSTARFNALKHGIFANGPIIPGEDPAHFEALRTSHYSRFQPVTREEHEIVAAMVRDTWTLERCSKSETTLWLQRIERYADQGQPFECAESGNPENLRRLQGRIRSTQCNYRRNLELLIKLQTARKKAGPGPEPISQPQSPEPLQVENGFVHLNPEIAPPHPPARVPSGPSPV